MVDTPLNIAPPTPPAPSRPWRISPLELVHPNGIAARATVIGSACPPMLQPNASAGSESYDLVVLAPSETECRSPGWLARAVGAMARSLADDGIGYVLAPRQYRAQIVVLLRRANIVLELPMLHAPNWSPPRHQVIVPLAAGTATYAFSKLIALNPRQRRVAITAAGFRSGRQLMGLRLPAAGLVVRRRGGRPLFDWLFKLDHAAPVAGSAIISTRWYGEDGTAIMHRFTGDERAPSAIVKLGLTDTTAGSRAEEAMLIGRFGPEARQAGARIPTVQLVHLRGDHPVMLQTIVQGQSAATVLAAQPQKLPEFLAQLGSWLARWNQATALLRPLEPELLEREILAPAQAIAPLLNDGAAYLEWLRARCAAVAGTPVPLPASHNDLTMWNVLLNQHNNIGVVDWEAARAEDLPLCDFYYGVADAAAAANHYRDRGLAYAACFRPGGGLAAAVAQLEARIHAAIKLPAGMATLCFHACWLRHATNEHEKKRPDEARPILQILQWLASNCHEYERQVTE